jgi:pyridoxal phosphate enzyme (YggS family)
MTPIAANLQAVRRRISEALQGDSREVRVVAVSKTRPAADIRAAFSAGCRDFGENYVQEALPKIAELAGESIAWHFIGPLQSNKARDVAERFDWFHALDRAKLAAALSRHRPADRGPLDVCIQVNISGEASKSGVQAGEALDLAREVAKLPGLKLRGLMGIAAPDAEGARARREFAALRAVYENLRAEGLALDTLSMGMTHDLEAAVAEGATMVRIGTAIFGERQ